MLKLSRLPTGEPEIFASVQGEGVTAGLPSVFVRLATCNLRCVWCDTRYTWDWAAFDPREQILTLDAPAVADQVLKMAPRNVVITGGEPLLQERDLSVLAARLRNAGLRLEVETNGTVLPSMGLAELVDQWNVSPKLENSRNAAREREVPSALGWFASHTSAYWKFVIVAPSDVDEAIGLGDRYGVPHERLVLMPEGTDAETLRERSLWLVERCRQTGARYSTRLHILLWGNERGR